MTIEHIVISGGGPPSLISYGALKELSKKNFWKFQNIKSIYGTSGGAFIAALLLLNYDWEWVDDYFIRRPWEDLVEINPETVININTNCGVIDELLIKNMLGPLFEGRGLSNSITMKDFYEYSNKNLCLLTTNLNKTKLEKIIITHKNYPELPVYKAVFMSLTIPGFCIPIYENGGCYIDGGYLSHFPVLDLVNNKDIDNDTILGILLNSISFREITKDTSLINIYFSLFNKLIDQCNKESLNKNIIKHYLECKPFGIQGLENWYNLIYDSELRKNHIQKGEQDAIHFLKEMNYEIEELIN